MTNAARARRRRATGSDRPTSSMIAVIVSCAVLIGSCTSDAPSDPVAPLESSATTTVPRPTPEEFAADDARFFAIPDPIPEGTHGDLLRYQPVSESPEGLTWYRMMYLSTTVTGNATVVTGVLTVPDDPAPEGGWKLATHAHGATGLADDCAPSRTIGSNPMSSAELRVVGSSAAARGFVVASTDYEGQGGPGRHLFLQGVSEGRAVLDAARAARGFPGLKVPTDLGIVGYSQGGHAALWANQIAAEWVPEFRVSGTFAGAPASEVASLLTNGPVAVLDHPWSVSVVAGFATADPDLDDDLDELLTPAGRKLLEVMVASCEPPEDFRRGTPLLTDDPTRTEPWKRLLEANTPGSSATGDPVLIIHSAEDEVIPVAHSATLSARLCRAGQVVERRVPARGGHGDAAVPAYSEGFDWLDDLTEGVEPVDSC